MNKRILWKKIKQRGAILQSNADGIMRDEGTLYYYDEDGNCTGEVWGWMPRTYSFKGVPAYNSYSALFPCGSKKNPKLFQFFDYDEDEGRAEEWVETMVARPLKWQTELEFLQKISEMPK